MSLISKVGRSNRKIKLLILLITGFLWLGVFLHLFPVWFSFSSSIKSGWEVFRIPSLWPKDPTLWAYKAIFFPKRIMIDINTLSIFVHLKNSFILCGGIIALQIPITALAAYSVSKLHDPFPSRFLFLFFISTMLIPYEISMVPLYLLLRHFPFATKSIPNIPFTNTPFPHYNFINTYWAVILPSLFRGFSFLLFKGHFDSIPDSLINAARLDGASEVGIFSRIILPLSKPVLAVVAYFTFSSAWNQFLWPLVVLSKREMAPLSVYMYELQTRVIQLEGYFPGTIQEVSGDRIQTLGQNVIMAAAIIQSIPVFIAFVIFREQLMKGIKLRGFK